MINTPSISVIVPVYKVERYVKVCVDSILAQTFQDFEIILVDDASPDGCVELCQKLYGDNDKVRLIRHEKNLGLGAARNTGMAHARGKYIYFVDSDDMILPDALEKLFNVAEKNSAQIVHAAGHFEFAAEPALISKENLQLKWNTFNTEGFLPHDLFYRFEQLWKKLALNPAAWSCLYRRDFLAANNLQFPPVDFADEPFQLAVLGTTERYFILHDAVYVERTGNADFADFAETIRSMLVGIAYIEQIFARVPKFDGYELWLESILATFVDTFEQRILPLYAQGKLSPETNEIIRKSLMQFFGGGTSFVKYFFDLANVKRLQAQSFLQQNHQMSVQISSLFDRIELSPRKIVFVNFLGKGYGCNPKYIAEEILRQNLPYDLVWLVNNPNEPMPAKIRKVVYDSVDSVYELATAKVIVTNTKNPLPFPNKKDGQYFIMTWHGGLSFKRIEKDTAETLPQWYIEQSKFNSKITDLMMTSCRVSLEEIRRAFWYTGEILKCGLPRNDIFFRRDDALAARIRKILNVPPENKIALYAPTFRVDLSETNVYRFDRRKVLATLRKKFGGKWTLLVRFHPNIMHLKFTQETFAADDVINVTNYPDMQELIFVSDVLISDYSTVIYDFMLCDKPVFIFAKDFDTYPNERKFNQVYFELPYKVNRTEAELFKCIKTFNAKELAHKRKKFLDALEIFDTGHASEEVVKKIRAVVDGANFNLHTPPPSRGIMDALNNWKVFVYVSERYGEFLAKLPIYESHESTPKIFWWCWLQGEDNAPPLCKICLKSLRRNYSDYKINVVTLENISQFVSFPSHIVDKFNAGKISRTHFSDLLRLELLINHGGMWIDSTVLCTGREQNFLHEPLFIFQGTWRNEPAHLGSNWFIVAQKGNPILRTTRDLLYQYWQDHDTLGTGGFYFVFHCMFKLAAQKYPELWAKVPVFSNVPPHILQFEFFNRYSPERFEQIKNMSHFHKLTWKFLAEQLTPERTSGTNYEYVMKFLS